LKRVESYLLKGFFSFFWPLFLTLFAVSSLVLLIRLADLTAIISINFYEFLSLYLYGTPQLLFYTLPIAFFLSLSLSLSKISFDRELVALFALGSKPSFILRPFFRLAVMLSFALLFIGYFLQPYSKIAAKNFIETKKSLSRLNIRPSEAGQKFGEWLVFVSSVSDGRFEDTALLRASGDDGLFTKNDDKNGSKTLFLSASYSKVDREDISGAGALILGRGVGYEMGESEAKVIHFESLKIRGKSELTNLSAAELLEYWLEALENKKRAKDFVDILLASTFALFSIYLGAAIGMVNPRYQKNRAAALSIAAIALFYALMLSLTPALTFLAILIIAPLWALGGYLAYKKAPSGRF